MCIRDSRGTGRGAAGRRDAAGSAPRRPRTARFRASPAHAPGSWPGSWRGRHGPCRPCPSPRAWGRRGPCRPWRGGPCVRKTCPVRRGPRRTASGRRSGGRTGRRPRRWSSSRNAVDARPGADRTRGSGRRRARPCSPRRAAVRRPGHGSRRPETGRRKRRADPSGSASARFPVRARAQLICALRGGRRCVPGGMESRSATPGLLMNRQCRPSRGMLVRGKAVGRECPATDGASYGELNHRRAQRSKWCIPGRFVQSVPGCGRPTGSAQGFRRCSWPSSARRPRCGRPAGGRGPRPDS